MKRNPGSQRFYQTGCHGKRAAELFINQLNQTLFNITVVQGQLR